MFSAVERLGDSCKMQSSGAELRFNSTHDDSAMNKTPCGPTGKDKMYI